MLPERSETIGRARLDEGGGRASTGRGAWSVVGSNELVIIKSRVFVTMIIRGYVEGTGGRSWSGARRQLGLVLSRHRIFVSA